MNGLREAVLESYLHDLVRAIELDDERNIERLIEDIRNSNVVGEIW